MKFPRKFICPDPRPTARAIPSGKAVKPSAFTLVELLVAMAVLTILVFILAQMMSAASLSWSMGKQRIDNLTKARVFLDLVTRDMQDGIFRPDLAAFIDQAGAVASASSTSYAFYSKRMGGGARSVTLLNYKVNQSAADYSLMRGALPINWTATPPSFAGLNAATIGLPELGTMTANDYSEVAGGVVGFRIYFINSDTTASPPVNAYSWNYLPWSYASLGSQKMSIAACVTLAVVDDSTQTLLNTNGQMSKLAASLTSPGTLAGSLKDSWDAQINTPGFFQSFPEAQVRSGLKVFQRVIPLRPVNL
jgi:prepilin-type N-terminal cleavage/methylation domain-containing protein